MTALVLVRSSEGACNGVRTGGSELLSNGHRECVQVTDLTWWQARDYPLDWSITV
jgi:hypothetical protein